MAVTLKVQIKIDEKKMNFYCENICRNSSHLLKMNSFVQQRLEDINQNIPIDSFRKYWIDDDEDRIEIMKSEDFEIFLRRNQHVDIPKVFFELIEPKKGPTNVESLNIHPTVECDVCLKVPIKGFRYKCLQCPNFDLCMKCESEMEHPKHLMLRIPTANSPPLEAMYNISGVFGKTARFPTNVESLNIYPTARCDVCLKAPIKGFRYKCLQCPNFDLCMKCESEMKHPEHLMLRIPTANSPPLETIYNILGVFGRTARRQQKHAARAAAAANAAAFSKEASGTESKSRSHRHHHRKHCAAATGLFSNFYDMMQDFAEGGVSQQNDETTPTTGTNSQEQASAPPQPETPIEEIISSAAKEAAAAAASAASAAAAAAAASAANSFSMDANKYTDQPSTSAAGAQTSPTAEGIPVSPSLEKLLDPQLMKAGIKILNNFSEMFGKILDPVVTEGASRKSSTTSSVNIDLTKEKPAASTPPPATAATPNKPGNSGQSSNVGSGLVTPMETESVANEPSPNRSRNSQSEEHDWTMIDNNVATGTEASNAPAATASTSTAAPLDFKKLSKQLQSHIENEMKSATVNLTPAAAPSSVPSVATNFTPTSDPSSAPTSIPSGPPSNPENSEKRAIAVFHADPRINSAVHGMMAMGFSNEGAVLTQLLESVNGNIPLALDLMSAAQSDRK